jgi:hypothetical protein
MTLIIAIVATAAVVLGVFLYNNLVRLKTVVQEGLDTDRRATAAATRPHPQPRRDGERVAEHQDAGGAGPSDGCHCWRVPELASGPHRTVPVFPQTCGASRVSVLPGNQLRLVRDLRYICCLLAPEKPACSQQKYRADYGDATHRIHSAVHKQ